MKIDTSCLPYEIWTALEPVEAWDRTLGKVKTATRGSLSAGEVVTLNLLVQDRVILDACFLAYGCEYTILCCALVCQSLIGKGREDLIHFNKIAWAERLCLPRQKYHTLLLIEEILLDLHAVFCIGSDKNLYT